MNVDSSGGAITSTTSGSAGAAAGEDDVDAVGSDTDRDAKPKPAPKTRETLRKSDSHSLSTAPTPKKPKVSSLTTATVTDGGADTGASVQRVAPTPKKGAPLPQAALDDVSVQRVEFAPEALTAGTAAPRAVSALVATPAAPGSAVSRWASTALSLAGLDSSATDNPVVPGQSPALLVMLAGARRLSQQGLVDEASSVRTADDPAQTSLMLAGADTGGQAMTTLAAAANSAPTASPTVGIADAATGAVTVSLNATDVDNNPLTYAVTVQPTNGSVTTTAPGVYKYTPTEAARLRSGTTPLTDGFTVTVSDVQGGSTAVQVSVPVSPTQVSTPTTVSVGATSNPAGVVVSGNSAFVVNTAANSVSVYDTANNYALIRTVTVGSSPTAIEAGADGNVWVANTGTNTVSRINTTTWAVTTITVGSAPRSIAVSPTDGSVWVANSGSNTVSRINPTTLAVTTVRVGTAPSAVAVSPDGTTVWVANASSNNVTRIRTSDNRVTKTITVGSAPIAIAATNTRVYVVNQNGNSVSIINVADNKVIATRAVGATPTSIALSRDGSLAYVANINDTVSIIDTKTNTVIATPAVDLVPDLTGAHRIAVGPDGRIYVTDAYDKSLRILSIVKVNSAPVPGTHTMNAPDPATGTVTGTVRFNDADNDALTYSLVSGPSSGTLSLSPSGAFTYTPSAAARDAAAQTSFEDFDSFTVRASDGLTSTTGPVSVLISPLASTPNAAPVATTPTISTRDMTTGMVTGSWTVSDPDGNPLSYTVTGPANGSVTITQQGTTYTYAYTPTQSARLPAAGTPGADYDNFTVVFSDGRASVNVPVTVPVLPAQLADTTFITYLPAGSKPVAVAVSETNAYVVNSGTNTLVVHGAGAWTSVIATIPVAPNPTAVALNPEYRRAYVVGNNAVSVIDTDNNTVVATITTGAGQSNGVAVSPDGDQVYVTNSDGTVSVINPVNNTIVGTIQVGANPAGVTFTPDGNFAYVANRGANTVTVINALTNSVVGSPIPVGASPTSVAVTPDGTRAYVTNYDSGSVSVIDTATNSVVGSPIQVGAHPVSVTISPDGSLAYVGIDSGIFVINTETNSWADHRYINGGTNTHTVGLSPDGRQIYITDLNENSLRQISIVRGNTAPVATTAPTAGTPEPVLGAVTGLLNVADPDGDALSYRVSGPTTAGSVTFDYAAGTYTFTPTQAARDAAAQTQGPDYATFTVTASDNVYPGGLSTDFTVTVPIAPSGAAIPITTTAINVGPSPGKVIISNGQAYVYNYSNRTVMVIDATTNQVTATIPVPAANDFVVGADGRIYVMGYDTVSVIEPNGTQVVPPIQVPDLCAPEGCWGSSGGLTDLVINSTGTRVYAVREYYMDTGPWSAVSMIDTASNTVIGTVSTYELNDIEVSPDGTRIYGAEGDYRFVQMFNAATLAGPTYIGVTAPGEWPYVTNVSISPDGKRTYALVGGTAWAYDPPVSISVIDSDPTSSTYNTQIATIALPGASDVAFSPDSSRAYVLMNDGRTVRVIDTATNTVVGYFTVAGANSIAVAPNGTVYLTNGAAGIVYAVTVGGSTSV
jgi:YVTN family beta-propeller protein